MRTGVGSLLIAMLAGAPVAAADPTDVHLELSGFTGVDYLGDHVRFGSDWIRDRATGAAPVVGARVGYLIAPAVDDDEHVSPFSGGIEAELAFTPTFTNTGTQADSNMSYLAPYLGYRVHVIARIGDDVFGVHAVAGGGALTVFSSAPFVQTQTSGQVYVGAGADVQLGSAGALRLDVRDAWMRALGGGFTPVYEVQLGYTRALAMGSL